MAAKPIYVETSINASLDDLWEHTQNPSLHEQWDLRFSEIRYLTGNGEEEQRFLYRRRIGFGLDISGKGVSRAARTTPTGESVSTLTFESGQKLSLIRKGAGFWKYRPSEDGSIIFITQYDYETRWGPAGKWFDLLVFRPLFGYATAWSFDLLRLWLENGVPPRTTIQRALIHYLSILLLATLWLYEGLVPKLLFPETGELALLRSTGLATGFEQRIVQLLGWTEIGIGAFTVLWHGRKPVYGLQAAFLLLLTSAALLAAPELLLTSFNPATLCIPMLFFCLLAYLTNDDIPRVSRCKRKPENVRRGRQAYAVDI